MSTVPRALRRARLWTAGLMTASTVLVGAIGIHLADARTTTARTVATQTSSGSSDTASNSSSSSGSSSSDDDGSSDDSASSSGFSAVAPVSGSNAQAQTSSGGS